MSQEWDFPQRKKPRRFERVIEHSREPFTLWKWYRKQMRGNDGLLYKANISALMLASLFILGLVAWAVTFFAITVLNVNL